MCLRCFLLSSVRLGILLSLAWPGLAGFAAADLPQPFMKMQEEWAEAQTFTLETKRLWLLGRPRHRGRSLEPKWCIYKYTYMYIPTKGLFDI